MSSCVCSDYTMTASQRQQLLVLYWGDRQPCQLLPPTEEDRTKRDGEGRRGIKGTKTEALLTFLIRAWLKSCLPSGVSWSNLLTDENVLLSFFLPFHSGQVAVRHSLCVLWSVPCHSRWLVDGLKAGRESYYASPLHTIPLAFFSVSLPSPLSVQSLHPVFFPSLSFLVTLPSSVHSCLSPLPCLH